MSHPATPARTPIAIGGGIGAGKSSVLEVFEQAGFIVIQADAVGHAILTSGHPARREVMERWPTVVVDGEVARPLLAKIVFTDSAALSELEAITHPAIRSEIQRRVSEAKAPVAVEAPILGMFSDGNWHRIAIVAPEETRIARAVARGGDPDDVRARMANQAPQAEWVAWADTIVDNGGSWESTCHALEPFVHAEVEG